MCTSRRQLERSEKWRLFITMLHFIARNIGLSRLNLNVNCCQTLWEAGNGGHAPLKFHLMWKLVHNRFWSHKNQPVFLWQLHLFFWKVTVKLKMAKERVNNHCSNRSSVVILTSPWSQDVMRWQFTVYTLSLQSEALEREPILVLSSHLSIGHCYTLVCVKINCEDRHAL